MATVNGPCQFAVAIWQEVETRKMGMELCGARGVFREQSDHGMSYGYHLCDEHVDMVGLYG